jgi:hypothetical protein
MSAAGADPHGERTSAARTDQLISYLDNLDPDTVVLSEWRHGARAERLGRKGVCDRIF